MSEIDRTKHDLDVMERVLSQVRDTAPEDQPPAAVEVTITGMAPDEAGILRMDEVDEQQPSTPGDTAPAQPPSDASKHR